MLAKTQEIFSGWVIFLWCNDAEEEKFLNTNISLLTATNVLTYGALFLNRYSEEWSMDADEGFNKAFDRVDGNFHALWRRLINNIVEGFRDDVRSFFQADVSDVGIRSSYALCTMHYTLPYK